MNDFFVIYEKIIPLLIIVTYLWMRSCHCLCRRWTRKTGFSVKLKGRKIYFIHQLIRNFAILLSSCHKFSLLKHSFENLYPINGFVIQSSDSVNIYIWFTDQNREFIGCFPLNRNATSTFWNKCNLEHQVANCITIVYS